MQLPYPNVRTPHLHPLPFRKGERRKIADAGEREGRPSSSRAFECGSLYASRFVEAGPEIARHVKLNSHLSEAIAIVTDTRALPYQDVECFNQARLVRITPGRLTIWLYPLGMLNPQIVMNLFPQVCVRMELGKHDQ